MNKRLLPLLFIFAFFQTGFAADLLDEVSNNQPLTLKRLEQGDAYQKRKLQRYLLTFLTGIMPAATAGGLWYNKRYPLVKLDRKKLAAIVAVVGLGTLLSLNAAVDEHYFKYLLDEKREEEYNERTLSRWMTIGGAGLLAAGAGAGAWGFRLVQNENKKLLCAFGGAFSAVLSLALAVAARDEFHYKYLKNDRGRCVKHLHAKVVERVLQKELKALAAEFAIQEGATSKDAATLAQAPLGLLSERLSKISVAFGRLSNVSRVLKLLELVEQKVGEKFGTFKEGHAGILSMLLVGNSATVNDVSAALLQRVNLLAADANSLAAGNPVLAKVKREFGGQYPLVSAVHCFNWINESLKSIEGSVTICSDVLSAIYGQPQELTNLLEVRKAVSGVKGALVSLAQEVSQSDAFATEHEIWHQENLKVQALAAAEAKNKRTLAEAEEAKARAGYANAEATAAYLNTANSVLSNAINVWKGKPAGTTHNIHFNP